ncbi:hypothetical protein Y1Q_0024667 [Alligator mississippiensis]|uniref:Uncharacterized protein n=1 Tax=Alligator mississippiensis TaxID=8496 RepID=A0A151PHB6_ALLMI|nr:hypothetical protein Y1Q_0024667 [Alligator mississippiensis]
MDLLCMWLSQKAMNSRSVTSIEVWRLWFRDVQWCRNLIQTLLIRYTRRECSKRTRSHFYPYCNSPSALKPV